jgi:hypothetical protein
MNNRSEGYSLELKIVGALKRKFETTKTNTILLQMKCGKNIEVTRIPGYGLSDIRSYEVCSLGYHHIPTGRYYGEAEGLDGVARILMNIK